MWLKIYSSVSTVITLTDYMYYLLLKIINFVNEAHMESSVPSGKFWHKIFHRSRHTISVSVHLYHVIRRHITYVVEKASLIIFKKLHALNVSQIVRSGSNLGTCSKFQFECFIVSAFRQIRQGVFLTFIICSQMSQYFSDMVFSILLAALMSLVFELPAITIERTLLRRGESTDFVKFFQQLKTSTSTFQLIKEQW